MRIALTGVSGFIGSVIARHLCEAGHQVTGLVRKTSRRDHIEPFVDRFVVGDHADESCWGDLLDGADCVVHNSLWWDFLRSAEDAFDDHIQSNLVGSLRLLKASAPRQFIFISSVSVHHDMLPRWEHLIDEDHPARPGSEYGAYKAAVEAHLWEEHFAKGRNTSAVRPSGVYGIDPLLKRSHGYKIIQRVRDKQKCNRPGGGKFVHVDDVAAVVAALCGSDTGAGRSFTLADCYARWGDLATMAAELLGVEADIDLSSPAQSKNQFTKDAVQSLGIEMSRGHAGLRAHIADLIEHMTRAGV